MAITSRFKILNFSHISKMFAYQSQRIALQFSSVHFIFCLFFSKNGRTQITLRQFSRTKMFQEEAKSLLQSSKIKIHEKSAGIRKKRVSFPLWMESTTHVQVNQYSLEHCIKEFFFLISSLHALGRPVWCASQYTASIQKNCTLTHSLTRSLIHFFANV